MELFNTESKKIVTDPLNVNNPISLQVLGICSALAVTIRVDQAIIMTFAVIFVLCSSNVAISLLKDHIPSRVRIVIMLAIIAGLVSFVDEVLKAYLYDMSKQLSVFVGLIVTNCIIMGRLVAFGMANGPWKSFLDGIGNSFGYAWILIAVAFFRELLGSGTLFGYPVLEKMGLYQFGYENNGMMILPPMALITVGIIIWIQRIKNKNLVESK